MTDSPTEQPDAAATHTAGPAAGAEDNQEKVTVSPAVAKAQALATSNADKASAEYRAKSRRDWWVIGPFAACIFPGLYILGTWYISGVSSSHWKPFHVASARWGLALLVVGISAAAAIGARKSSRRAAFQRLLMSEAFSVRMAELDSAASSDAPLVANRELLGEYHRLSTSQAKSAFQLAQWVMGASALLVSAGAVGVGLAPKTATAVTLASLTAFVTALSGYISSTLLATYRVSVEQARFYFREPLTGGYLLAAEHLAARLNGPEREAALGRVVDGFIQAAVNVPGALPDTVPPQDTQGPATPA
ncbi:hypothetical protein [Streptomyces doebereineriae]|uniref:ABC transporter n=1 Tax=Streptomyces doebereineriae TaxID=3075528 RepID=A0ABU2VRB9_9ACTN|nr:hypothetical protein [Streptomyces sp. DSM 41640]MDT0488160.1 hypothetical protein [Streptomyces sp. DSM 41640]